MVRLLSKNVLIYMFPMRFINKYFKHFLNTVVFTAFDILVDNKSYICTLMFDSFYSLN